MNTQAPLQNTKLHFVGIGGIGMSGIAQVLANQGYQVTGSDQADSDTIQKLRTQGIKINIGHDPKMIQGSSVVVISSAIREHNPEVLEARRLRIPVIPRAEMLGELMRGKTGIAVAGSHGKTTSTSMLATILSHSKLDPTIVIGGKVDALGGNAKYGKGQVVVAEADESDGSFFFLPAVYSVVTNIDNDHLDHYGSLEAIQEAFADFVNKTPFYGLAAVCADDPGVSRCLPLFKKPFVTYGLSEEWDFSVGQLVTNENGTQFNVYQKQNGKNVELGKIQLPMPGRHNVLNALSAIVIALRLEIPFSQIKEALSRFGGVQRRFQVKWKSEKKSQMVIDDYGHHPTEIAATLETARSIWGGRIVTVFQPHRYSRTQFCKDRFIEVLRQSDVVYLTDVYAAGEDPIKGISSELIVQEMNLNQKNVFYSGDLHSTQVKVLEQMSDGDLIICLGAGSITQLSHSIVEKLLQNVE